MIITCTPNTNEYLGSSVNLVQWHRHSTTNKCFVCEKNEVPTRAVSCASRASVNGRIVISAARNPGPFLTKCVRSYQKGAYECATPVSVAPRAFGTSSQELHSYCHVVVAFTTPDALSKSNEFTKKQFVLFSLLRCSGSVCVCVYFLYCNAAADPAIYSDKKGSLFTRGRDKN